MSRTNVSTDSFEKLGLHTNVCVALSSKGMNGPYPQQASALMHTARDMCDVLATVHPHTGRHTLLVSFAAHCVLSSTVPRFALIIAGTNSRATKMINVASMLGIMGVSPFLVTDSNDKSRTSGCVTPSIVITTLATVLKWPGEEFLKCASMLVEDCAQHGAKELEGLMHTVSSASDPMNMFMLTTQPLTEVPVSIRYALHRRRRRFCPLNPMPPAYTFLLATDQEDRLNLLRKIVQIKSLRRILVLTHSKEVKDLRMKLQQWGMTTFALGRNAMPNEQSNTIGEFINTNYSVLVASDAYSGLDIMDVDGVVQFYPPQKSMDEDEWSDYVRCIRTTCHPSIPTRFITLLGTDDFTLGAYFTKRAECEGPIMNVTPNHPRFVDIVCNPLPAALERVNHPIPATVEFAPPTAKSTPPPNSGAGAAGNGKGKAPNDKHNGKGQQGKNNGKPHAEQQQQQSTPTTATAVAGGGGGAAPQQPLSKKDRDAEKEKARELQKAREKQKEINRQREKELQAAAAARKAAKAAAAAAVGGGGAAGAVSGAPAAEASAGAAPSQQQQADGQPLSNRAKRRLAAEEERKRREAKAEARAAEANRQREREKQKEKERERQREKGEGVAAANGTAATEKGGKGAVKPSGADATKVAKDAKQTAAVVEKKDASPEVKEDTKADNADGK